MGQVSEGGRTGQGAAGGVPLVLGFGGTREPADPSKSTDLFNRIVQRCGRSFDFFLLEDRDRSGFYRGASGLGHSIESTATVLRAMIREIGPSQVITFGEGAGGHAALVFGVLLGASRIVALEPPAHLIVDELHQYNDRRWHLELGELPDPATARRYDVPRLIADAGFHGRAFVLFGTRRDNGYHDAVHLNTIHAHRLALADPVILCPFPDLGHGVLPGLIERGDAEDVLSHYLFEADEPPLAAPPSTSLGPDKLSRITTKLFKPFQFHIMNISHTLNNDPVSGVAFAVAGRGDVTAVRRVDDGWRSWIAENLMLGASPLELEDVLVDHGIAEEEAAREVSNTLQSPYFWGTQRLRNRLKKRDWLLATYRKLQRLHPESAEVERRHRLTREEWLDRFVSTNRPVLITGMMDDWPAFRNWSLDAFSRRFGEREVEIERGDGRERDCPPQRRKMSMADYLNRLRQPSPGIADGSLLSIGEGTDNARALGELWDDIGDLSEYLESRESKPGSIRIGAADAFVPFRLHPINVLLAQLMGRTQVRFAHSWDLPLIPGTPPLPSRPDGEGPTPPSLLPLETLQVVECLLEPGEILFLPAGSWWLLENREVSATAAYTRLPFDNTFRALPEDLER